MKAAHDPGAPRLVATLNSGSSSLKFSVFREGQPPQRLASGLLERIGGVGPRFRARNFDQSQLVDESVDATSHEQAIARVVDYLEAALGGDSISAFGHRIVHGGERYIDACLIDESVLTGLRSLIPLAPSHLPGEIAAIKAVARLQPGIPQIAAFDTAFHRSLPPVARRLPIPRSFDSLGLRRFGFHGLSYQFLLEELERSAGPDAARGRVIFAHLGAGCSLAAVRNRTCLETTMGFTPTAGLMMATRTGDLDPGVMIHLQRHAGVAADGLEALVNHRSGLLGVSETSADVRDLLAAETHDPRAAEAIDMFCYSVRGWIARLAAAIEGIDTIVFSAGIGENSSVIRSRICQGLQWLGVALDEPQNEAGAAVISRPDSPVVVRVIRTNEELMIFEEVLRLIRSGAIVVPA